MYALVLYRLNALDQRVPIVTAALTGVLGCVVVLPTTLQLGLLFGLPLSLVWLVRTTVNHARSLEDALRLIEHVECEVNANARRQVMSFQSTHPSRGIMVGGRTGEETVQSVIVISAMLLAGCVWLASEMLRMPAGHLTIYAVYICFVTLGMIRSHRELRFYRYQPQLAPSPTSPPRG